MKRSEIRKILKRHRGSKAELARRAGVTMVSISTWLRGSVSANITGKAEILARELLLKEEASLSVRALLPKLKGHE